MRNSVTLAACILALVAARASFAQYAKPSSVLDGSGTIATGGSFTNISAAGQPGGISQCDNGTIVNQAGFLNTFFLRPNLDTDKDGLPDEADLDNDNDGLRDTVEIAGTSFNPPTPSGVNTADSDGDGISDGREALAGTDPTDANSQFELVKITTSGNARVVSFLARGNNERTYVVKASSGTYAQPSQVLFSNTVAGGTAPWYETTNTLVDSATTNARFYSVEVYP